MKDNLSEDSRAHLMRQLVQLGDMLGDGDCEPWVGREYRRVCSALGMTSRRKPQDTERRKRLNVEVNKRMEERVTEVKCSSCEGVLKQVRSGSMKARCLSCGSGFTLLKKTKVKK